MDAFPTPPKATLTVPEPIAPLWEETTRFPKRKVPARYKVGLGLVAFTMVLLPLGSKD